jgi:hypothetical protein
MPQFKILVQYEPNVKPLIVDVEYDKLPTDFKVWGWDHFAQAPIYSPADAPSHREKLDANLNHHRRVEFETHLAFSVLKNYKIFLPTLHKLGHAIAHRLDSKLQSSDKNKDIERKSAAGAIFKKTFYSNKGIFGTLGEESAESDLENYQRGLMILRKGKAIEHIFSAHIGALKIYREVLGYENDRDFHYWWQQVRGDLFISRGREKLDMPVKLVTFPGIEVAPTIAHKMQAHKRALDKTTRDYLNVTPFVWEAYQKDIPFVAGPSGTASECLVGLKTMGRAANLTPEEIKEYLICCMGYLVSSGAHSLHEIYVLCGLFPMGYVPGRYEAVIPASFSGSASFQRLLANYSDLIQADIFVAPPAASPVSVPPLNRVSGSSSSAVFLLLEESKSNRDTSVLSRGAASSVPALEVADLINSRLSSANTPMSCAPTPKPLNRCLPVSMLPTQASLDTMMDAQSPSMATPTTPFSFGRQLFTPPLGQELLPMSNTLLNRPLMNPKAVSPLKKKNANYVKRDYDKTEQPVGDEEAAIASFEGAKRKKPAS